MIDGKNAVDVICQHSKDGTIIPLRVRLVTEDGEYETFTITGYRRLENDPALGSANRTFISFSCKVQAHERERRFKLSYNTYQMLWYIDKT